MGCIVHGVAADSFWETSWAIHSELLPDKKGLTCRSMIRSEGALEGCTASASSIVKPLAGGFKQERAENRFRKTTLVIVWEKLLRKRLRREKTKWRNQ